jgi:hypothetical protein
VCANLLDHPAVVYSIQEKAMECRATAILRIAGFLGVLLVCAAGSTGCTMGEDLAPGQIAGQQLAGAPIQLDDGFSVAILPDTTGLDNSQLRLALSERDGYTVLDISADRLRNHSRLYVEVRYEQSRFQPLDACPAGRLDGNPAILHLLAEAAPGVAHYGQLLVGKHPAGINGDAKLARIRFSGVERVAAPDSRAAIVRTAGGAIPAVGNLVRNDCWNMIQWSHLNPGDYDQNGAVNISDLTPLGLHFGATGPFNSNSVQWVVDGDHNGEINLADITVIGQNFGNEVAGYDVYASPKGAGYPAAGGARKVDSVSIGDALGSSSERKYFRLSDLAVCFEDRYWVMPAGGGAASNLTGEWARQWHIQEIHAIPYDGGFSTDGMAFRVIGDRPCAAWAGGDGGNVLPYFATADNAVGADWQDVVVVPTGYQNNSVRRVLNLDGLPGVVISDYSSMMLWKSGNAEGTAWNPGINIANGSFHLAADFVIDGRLRLLMIDSGGMYMVSGDAAVPMSFNAAEPVTSLTSASAFIFNGQLAIAYRSKSTYDAYFGLYDVVGDQAAVSSFSLMDSSGSVSTVSKALEFDDRPFVWVCRDEETELYQIRSADATGEVWNAPQQLDLGQGYFGSVDVIVAYGQLFLFMRDLDDAGFVTWTNPDGAAGNWQQLGEIMESSGMPLKTRMDVVRGHPAAILQTEYDSALRYYYARFY